MLHKIMNAFMNYANDYMETCANNGLYTVYTDMVKDQMENTDR